MSSTLTPRRTPPRRPLGTRLHSLTPTDRAGTSTIADYIIEQIKSGVHPITAAAAAGIDAAEYRSWLTEGQLVISKLNNGACWETDFTPSQQDMALFAQTAIRAHARRVSRLSKTAAELADGGIELRTTRTKSIAVEGSDDVKILEVVETVSHSLPDASMVQWQLEKLEPTVFGKTATLNVLVVDLTDTDAVKDLVQERMEQIVQRMGAIETTASEEPDGPPA